MLAMSDRHGRVWASIPGLAKEAAVSVDACRVAIDKFLSPDIDSRTKVKEGRRIEPIDGGWRLINHAKYRAIRDEEERRAYKTEKQRQYRSVDNVDTCGPALNDVDGGAHNAEAEADTEANKKASRSREGKSSDGCSDSKPRAQVAFDLPKWVPETAWNAWLEVRKRKRAANTVHALNLAVRELEKLKGEGHSPEAVLNQSTLKSYTGLFPVSVNNGAGIPRQSALEGMRFANEKRGPA